jgi:hypothetical protein
MLPRMQGGWRTLQSFGGVKAQLAIFILNVTVLADREIAWCHDTMLALWSLR